VNTDNRLMSGISLSSELAGLVETFDWSWRDINWLTINAMKSAFCPFDERLALIDGRIKPGFDTLDPDAVPARPSQETYIAHGSLADVPLID
jgi:adenosine deaminase